MIIQTVQRDRGLLVGKVGLQISDHCTLLTSTSTVKLGTTFLSSMWLDIHPERLFENRQSEAPPPPR